MTYNQGDTLFVRDPGNFLVIRHIVERIANGLDIDSLGTIVDGSCEIRWLVATDKFGVNAQAREEDLELVVCASV